MASQEKKLSIFETLFKRVGLTVVITFVVLAILLILFVVVVGLGGNFGM